MNSNPRLNLHAIGHIESPLVDLDEAPAQGDEGAPDAWIVLRPEFAPAAQGLRVGDPLVVLTWLDRANRNILEVHPRGDRRRPLQGVFSTRSPHRPNPIGIHVVRILAHEGSRIKVSNLEAIDGTPVVDLKPVLGPVPER